MVKKGEPLCLIGDSGTGKTHLLPRGLASLGVAEHLGGRGDQLHPGHHVRLVEVQQGDHPRVEQPEVLPRKAELVGSAARQDTDGLANCGVAAGVVE